MYTNFAIHADGGSRMVLLAGHLHPRRLGRLVQRLLEIETYRMAALLSLPAARRQDALSRSVSRMSNLLRTRVEVEQQQGIQAPLASMNLRQDLQLKLQSTVEGLSVAAITYYIVGMVSYLAKGAQHMG